MMPRLPLRRETRVFVGVDPGASGGLVALRGGKVLATPMPRTELDLWRWFDELPAERTVAVVEKVWGHTGENQPGSAMFNFGDGFGQLKMALTAAGISYELITPQTWQKALAIPKKTKTESKSQWKERLRAHAQRLFPNLPLWSEPRSKGKQLAVADALLLSEFCRRRNSG